MTGRWPEKDWFEKADQDLDWYEIYFADLTRHWA